MNKNRHRIVFNAARGQHMAVSETATSNTGVSTVTCPSKPLRWNKLCLAVLVAWSGPQWAQIVADPSAPGNQRPIVLQTANGTPLVQIRTPSAAGVSRNAYSAFDIQSNGVVLNNVRSNAAQTQIGGFVQANPFLTTGAARVILNEVNSSNPTYLKGPVEVAGQRAEVIVANPSGIRVNGGTFLNASGVTLTTGTPVMNSGNLESFRVGGGTVVVEGLGLDTRTADHTTILARAMEVNAGLWAKHLKVVTGANQISADAGTISATPADAQGPAPRFMLDVAAIGGMYAGHIYLVGTEAGLGVNNRGTLAAQEGEWVLRADGWLVNTGKVQAKGDLSIQTTGAVSNTGAGAVIGAQGSATVNTGAALSNTGGATLAAVGSLDVTASGPLANTQSTMAANGAVDIAAASIDNTHGTLASVQSSLQLTALSSGDLNNTSGYLGAGGALSATAGQITNAAGGRVVGESALTLTATSIHNTASVIETPGHLTLNVLTSLNNAGGTLSAGKNLTAQDNATEHTLSITNTGGKALSGANNTLRAASLTGDGTVHAAANLSIDLTGDFESTTAILAGGHANLTTAGTFTNRAELQAGGTATVQAAELNNTVTGEIAGASTRVTATNNLVNRGLIDGGDARIKTDTLTNIGTGRIFGDHLAIAATN